MKRSRGRNRRSGGSNQNNFNNPNRHFESVGPDVKIRGSAQQVLEKYQQYARDAQTSGDRILSEAYYQFAEHYLRIVAKQQEARERAQQQRGSRDDRDQGRRDDRDSSRNDGDGDGATEKDKDEAETAEASVERRDADTKKSDAGDDAMRVIDGDKSDDDVKASSGDDGEQQESRSRSSGRRRTYKSREKEPKADADPADGVLKTVARGRRKSSGEGAETSAETTD